MKEEKGRKVSADPLLKTVVRAFRRIVKAQFRNKYGKGYFHQNQPIHEKYDKFLFTAAEHNGGLAISDEVYYQNKQILETILYSTQNKIQNLGQNEQIIKSVVEVLGSKPANSNLAIFFRNEAIQALW